jgi:3-oxoacyl-[acyl-carrier-protein] synthase II
MSSSEKVVVTGLGVISPVGKTHSVFFDSLLEGKSGIGKIDRFDASTFKCQIGGQVLDFNPRDYYNSKQDNRIDGAGYWLALDMAINEEERRSTTN